MVLLDTHAFLWYLNRDEKQALAHGLTLLSADENIAKYAVPIFWGR